MIEAILAVCFVFYIEKPVQYQDLKSKSQRQIEETIRFWIGYSIPSLVYISFDLPFFLSLMVENMVDMRSRIAHMFIHVVLEVFLKIGMHYAVRVPHQVPPFSHSFTNERTEHI
jgi:hypothetical protein